jgi:hypothetical protein
MLHLLAESTDPYMHPRPSNETAGIEASQAKLKRRPEMTKKDGTGNDFQMTSEQKAQINRLSEADIKDIDDDILENASYQWSKALRIVLATMIEREEGVTGLPEVFYFERISSLVEEGLLESRGDVRNMRSCEVRLAEKK